MDVFDLYHSLQEDFYDYSSHICARQYLVARREEIISLLCEVLFDIQEVIVCHKGNIVYFKEDSPSILQELESWVGLLELDVGYDIVWVTKHVLVIV